MYGTAASSGRDLPVGAPPPLEEGRAALADPPSAVIPSVTHTTIEADMTIGRRRGTIAPQRWSSNQRSTTE